MLPDALVIAPLLVALVLVTSAIGKLRAPERAGEAFTALEVPRSLARPAVIRLHPWAEILLAVLLVVVPSWPGVVCAVLALLLMLAYLGLVARALRRPVDVDCACFGALGADTVTSLTLWRNGWLVALATATVWRSLDGRALLGQLGGLGSDGWWWLGAAVAASTTVALILWNGQPSSAPLADEHAGITAGEDAGADYLRTRIPAVPVTLGDGSSLTLRELSKDRAQLLVFLSETCGGCQVAIESLPAWRAAMPEIDVRMIIQSAPGETVLTSAERPMSLHDPDRLVRESFGFIGTPSAILLGADGLLAGGPVAGASDVDTFVAEVVAQLRNGQPERVNS